MKVASIFRAEEKAGQDTNVKAGGSGIFPSKRRLNLNGLNRVFNYSCQNLKFYIISASSWLTLKMEITCPSETTGTLKMSKSRINSNTEPS
jgi:hypothetical protein